MTDWVRMLWAGLVATVLLLAVPRLIQAWGRSVSLPILVGGVFLADVRRPTTETLGFVLVLLVGTAGLPWVYDAVFAAAGGPSLAFGAALGAAHGMIVAAALPLVGTISASVRGRSLPPPGDLGRAWGWLTAIGLLAGHIAYGGALGAILASF